MATTDGGTELSLRILTIASAIYVIRIQEQANVTELKRVVASETGVVVEHQRLIFQGKVLKDDQPISAYAIRDGMTIHLVFYQPPPAVAPEQTTSRSVRSTRSSSSSTTAAAAPEPNPESAARNSPGAAPRVQFRHSILGRPILSNARSLNLGNLPPGLMVGARINVSQVNRNSRPLADLVQSMLRRLRDDDNTGGERTNEDDDDLDGPDASWGEPRTRRRRRRASVIATISPANGSGVDGASIAESLVSLLRERAPSQSPSNRDHASRLADLYNRRVIRRMNRIRSTIGSMETDLGVDGGPVLNPLAVPGSPEELRQQSLEGVVQTTQRALPLLERLVASAEERDNAHGDASTSDAAGMTSEERRIFNLMMLLGQLLCTVGRRYGRPENGTGSTHSETGRNRRTQVRGFNINFGPPVVPAPTATTEGASPDAAPATGSQRQAVGARDPVTSTSSADPPRGRRGASTNDAASSRSSPSEASGAPSTRRGQRRGPATSPIRRSKRRRETSNSEAAGSSNQRSSKRKKK